MRALLIEDDVLCAFVEKRLLESVGFEVEHCSVGLEGVKKAKSDKFDVILTDMDLPDMNGNEVAMCIKTFQSNDKAVPIYAISANKSNLLSFRDDYIEARIEKPFSRRMAMLMLDDVKRHLQGAKQ